MYKVMGALHGCHALKMWLL